MNRQDFRFFHPLRVRWVEVDMQKIVFNAHYLTYFDTAISDYWRALALPYEESMHSLGGDLYVRKASVEYHGSARFDDRLDVALRCSRVGNSSILFAGAIFRGDELLITAELVYVFADPVAQTPKPVPDSLRQVLMTFEDGGTMSHVKLGTWAELGTQAAPVRVEVFVKEQGVPLAMEWDEFDAMAVHAVTFNGLGTALATGRLVMQAQGKGRIGRMAVTRVLRGSRLGREVLHALLDEARRRGCGEVLLHAQLSARDFYHRSGFTARGEPFEEASIPHIEMFKSL